MDFEREDRGTLLAGKTPHHRFWEYHSAQEKWLLVLLTCEDVLQLQCLLHFNLDWPSTHNSATNMTVSSSSFTFWLVRAHDMASSFSTLNHRCITFTTYPSGINPRAESSCMTHSGLAPYLSICRSKKNSPWYVHDPLDHNLLAWDSKHIDSNRSCNTFI